MKKQSVVTAVLVELAIESMATGTAGHPLTGRTELGAAAVSLHLPIHQDGEVFDAV